MLWESGRTWNGFWRRTAARKNCLTAERDRFDITLREPLLTRCEAASCRAGGAGRGFFRDREVGRDPGRPQIDCMDWECPGFHLPRMRSDQDAGAALRIMQVMLSSLWLV